MQSIKDLQPIVFKYKDGQYGDTNRDTMGFSANDVNKLFSEHEYSIVSRDKDGYMNVDYVQLIAPLFNYIKELEKRIIELEEKNK